MNTTTRTLRDLIDFARHGLLDQSRLETFGDRRWRCAQLKLMGLKLIIKGQKPQR